jgi:hypothetical protein
MRRARVTVNPLKALRRRLIRETELALVIGLMKPDRQPRIPTVEVGRGSFDPEFSRRFWEGILGDTSHLQRISDEDREEEYITIPDTADRLE